MKLNISSSRDISKYALNVKLAIIKAYCVCLRARVSARNAEVGILPMSLFIKLSVCNSKYIQIFR